MRNEKIFAGKTLAILSGGGDTPAINSSIEAVRNRASMLGFKVYGILRGWKGLLGDGDVVDLTNIAYNGIYGGTGLLSSRTNPFPSKKNPEDRSQQILKNIERYKIDVLVTIGGGIRLWYVIYWSISLQPLRLRENPGTKQFRTAVPDNGELFWFSSHYQ